jgi:hypothetical protein
MLYIYNRDSAGIMRDVIVQYIALLLEWIKPYKKALR